MRPPHFLLIAVCSLVPAEALASWLQLNKSQGGYLFEALSKEEPFSFDVPGQSVRTSGGNGRAFARIDDVVVQVMRAPLPTAVAGGALDAHMASEVAYLQEAGAAISESAVCSRLTVPHREWMATLANGSTSTYLTILLKSHVLVVVLARDSATDPGALTTKLSALCGSLRAA